MLHHATPFVLAALCAAQQSLVIPPAHSTLDAPSKRWTAAATAGLRQQILIDAAHLTPLAGRLIDSVSWRRDADYKETLTGGQTHVTVRVSTSPLASSADARDDMTQNAGVDELLVFQGIVDAPASPAVTGASVPWDPQNAIELRFVPPFPYAGGTLCIDVTGLPTAATTSHFWPADARSDHAEGSVRDVGASCQDQNLVPLTNGTASHTVAAQELVLGSSALAFARATPFAMASLLIGLGERTPPLDLAPIGARGCALLVEPLAALPPRAVSGPIQPAHRPIGGYVAEPLFLPLDQRLYGARFATQWVEWNGPRIATTNAQVCTVASTLPAFGMALVSARFEGTTAPSRGLVDRRTVPVVRLGSR
jgi:hypothetical protein